MERLLDGVSRPQRSDQTTRTPFISEGSFAVEQSGAEAVQDAAVASLRSNSPFQSMYQMEGHEPQPAPEAREFVEFMADLYDTDFNDAVLDVADEATEFLITRSAFQSEEGPNRGTNSERLLETHFEPFLSEVDRIFDRIGESFDRVDLETMSEVEFDRLLENSSPEGEEPGPDVENLFGGLKNAWKKIKKKAKKAARKAWKKAKSAARGVGKIVLKAAWSKLKAAARQMIVEVLRRGMEKIPAQYRGLAETVAKKLGVQTQPDPEAVLEAREDAREDFDAIQHDFDAQIASIVLESDSREQDRNSARYVTLPEQPVADPVGDLRRARTRFISRIVSLEDREDPGPDVEEFVQAVLTAAKWGIRIAGKPRAKRFLAGQISRLLKRWTNRSKARSLGKIIADVGVEIIMTAGHGEAEGDFEESLGGSAIAQLVEDTANRVSRLPDHVLEDERILEGYIVEAFDDAARANLPDVLPDRMYKDRPTLRESCKGNGLWVAMPSGFYKKYTRILETTICPHLGQTLTSFGAIPLGTVLRDHYGLSPGRTIGARVHLYEAMTGCRLFHIARSERDIQGFATNPRIAWSQIHPLTTMAASLLTGEPCLGRDVASRYLDHPRMINSDGQRFYYLQIEEARPQTTTAPGGIRSLSRSTELNITLGFPRNRMQLFLFLSEADSQEAAVRLRQGEHTGTVSRNLVSAIGAGQARIFSSGMYSRVKVVHPAVMPGTMANRALKRLSPAVTEKLSEKVRQWTEEALSRYLEDKKQDVIAAVDDERDGMTMMISMNNVPGLSIIGELLTGGGVPLRGSWFPEGAPDVGVSVESGFHS